MKQKGFSLLEMIIVVLLTVILLEAVLEIFSNVYRETMKFYTKVNYSEELHIVSDFIRDEIRCAEEVSVVVSDEEHEVIEPEKTTLATEGRLKEIKLYTKDGTTGKIKMIKNRNTQYGKYSLVYEATGTQNLISNLVDDIQVVHEENSSYVTFQCTIAQIGATTRSKLSFTESLAYKAN